DVYKRQALEYLAQETGGAVLYLYRPEGIGPVLQGLRKRSSGIYQLQYTSRLPTNFGNAYLPLEVEVYLLQRSGRDILGYFAPLE
ncbi:MAG: 6-bladed beta-propeller, partial [Treponemataceae bacterium]|nr:6-bladed beta-propeller [Treponemataceae bacterium]